MDLNLKGKVALVAGASRGLGLGVARLLAALGAAAGAVLLRAGMGGDLVGASPPLSERKPA
jgi:NAD(P)-dependent dehydrogenase (short-subunit alcohol dehydrogenase family)